ncbi:4-hydroxythreonine-4-phosphate dehydrogenase PdxA [Hyphomicrobium sp.]|uniref:4-hydroxythreonine-4-phosphate dehydrogenase PdxA n=1 Tax=Hyphomicrobium sp. TaxID=82 RepID=UPI000F97D6EA|nr:4-hydroxythreonine-4-phosphate dehydrogenase PdxA [Hyphomicrobium sp.]RUO98837.1 MAG: 4-hydroxythreonine-4-phosphate dehydrogenase PdxA [Hyphomicrobium sp.]
MSAPDKELRVSLALTMGDPAGVGPELALQAWRDRNGENIPAFALYADVELMRELAGALGLDAAKDIVPVANASAAATVFADALPVVPIPLAAPRLAGTPDVANGPATILSINRAVADIAAGHAAAIVTNPIAKAVLYDAGFAHPGHTEYLGTLAQEFWPAEPAEPVMMIAAPGLRVVPVTIHVPLKDVPALLTTDLIVRCGRIVHSALKRDFGIARPRIVVAGLNPHAGENGALGSEDEEIVRPAIVQLRAEGIDATGPFSADTLFHQAVRKTYDAALTMYHDQGLIPIKTLAFDEGVNVTLGLPFVRTSPDHGTAFVIAGKGIASATSLIAALKLAAEMVARRATVLP